MVTEEDFKAQFIASYLASWSLQYTASGGSAPAVWPAEVARRLAEQAWARYNNQFGVH
jgi:hypothetical protein